MKEIKLHKSLIYAVIITFILTLSLSAFAFKFYPEMQRENVIKSYKKSLFNSVLCQYSCPLTNQTAQNKTQLLPTESCIRECTSLLQNNKNIGITNQDLADDNLIKDVEDVVNNCRTSSISQGSIESISINNELFFDCVKSGLSSIKSNYNYLN